MSKFLFASIGRKFMMSITGIFLLMFIAVHLGINLLLIFDDSGELFNLGAHLFTAQKAHTFFGQFNQADNIYTRLKFHF